MRIAPIEGWEGYFAREDGAILSDRCKRLRGIKQKERVVIDPMRRHRLTTFVNPVSGYEYATLTVKQKSKSFAVHKLILEAFAGQRPTGKEIRHLDGNKLNNNLSNLAWGTHAENERDKIAHGTLMKGDTHANSKLTVAKVREIKRRHAQGEQQQDIAKDYGVHKATVNDIFTGKTWRHVK